MRCGIDCNLLVDGVKCPVCGAALAKVLDTRTSMNGEIIRRRECLNGHRFRTVEYITALKCRQKKTK